MKLVSTNISKLLLLLIMSIAGSIEAQEWSLDQCIDSAMLNNKKLKISKNEMEIVAQKQKEVKANLLPKITANGDYKYYTDLPYQLMPMSVFGGPEGQYKEAQFGVPHNINANLQLSMPLYSPELYGGIEATKIVAEVSELQYQKTEEQTYFDIANLYYNAQIIKSQIAFLDSNSANSERLLKNVQLLNVQLLAQKTDVDKVVLQVRQIASKKMILESKYSQVINGLKLLMGVSQSQAIEVEASIVHTEELAYATQSTLDFRLAETKFNLLSSELNTLKKSRYLPSAYLYGSYGTMGYGYDEQPNDFLNFYAIGFVGVKFSYPIFNGTVTNKKINQKNLELKNNDLQKELLKDQQNTQTENALLQRNVAQETMKTSELQIELAQIIYTQTTLQQKEGLAKLTDVLLADNVLREAQQDYIGAVVEYLKADLELKRITGNIK